MSTADTPSRLTPLDPRAARKELLHWAEQVERDLKFLRTLAPQAQLPLEQRDRLRLAHDTLTFFIVEEASHG